MAIHTTYSEARANLARLWDHATHDRETVVISRRAAEDLAMMAADELAALQETAHLLRSPNNAASQNQIDSREHRCKLPRAEPLNVVRE